jgi:transforming growth factor-beta-induced protein
MIVLLAGLAVALPSCRKREQPPQPREERPEERARPVPRPPVEEEAEKDIVDTAVEASSFTTLAAALNAADLVETLKGEGPFTVFAPTDDAFKKLPAGALEDLLKPENKHKLQAILKHHVVAGAVMAAEVTKLKSAKTVLGQELTIAVKDDKVMVDGATVTQADIECSNGVIHVIDTVLMPKDILEMAAAAGSFKTLATALAAAGLVDTLKGSGPFTVFAPTDEAFGKLPAGTLPGLLQPDNKPKLSGILTYHVVPGYLLAADVAEMKTAKTVQGQELTIAVEGEKVMVDGATIVTADIGCTNGVIHVIDSVILPK